MMGLKPWLSACVVTAIGNILTVLPITNAFQYQPYRILPRCSIIAGVSGTPSSSSSSSSSSEASDPSAAPSQSEKSPSSVVLSETGKQNFDWFIYRFGCAEDSLVRIVQNGQFNVVSNSELIFRADWLQQRLNLTDIEMSKTIKKEPKIISTPETSMERTLQGFEAVLNLDQESLKKVILTSPTLLNIDFAKTIQPKLQYLQNRLVWDNETIAKSIGKCSRSLNLSLDAIKKKLDWIQQRLNFTDDARLGSVIRRYPNTLTLSIDENLEPKLEWMQKRLSLSTGVSLGNVIEKFPPLLGCNVTSNLEPTIEFYENALSGDGGISASSMLANNPHMLGASLKNRLLPRLEQAKEAGISIDCNCLSRISKFTDDKWSRSLVYQAKKSSLGKDQTIW